MNILDAVVLSQLRNNDYQHENRDSYSFERLVCITAIVDKCGQEM